MTGIRKISITFGILIITSIISGIFSSEPALERPDYITKLAGIRTQMLTAVFFQSVMAAACTGIAFLLYPLVRKYSDTAAGGYFAFNIPARTLRNHTGRVYVHKRLQHD